jgi:hypothetical protein
MTKIDPNTLKVANEILNELIAATVADDNKLKDFDKSIDPSSISYSTHLALTLKEFLNATSDQ